MRKRLSAFAAVIVLLIASIGGIVHSGTAPVLAQGAPYYRDYSNVDTSVPIFPSPESWFKWSQRSISKAETIIIGSGQSFLEGWGDIHPDWTYEGKTYKQTHFRNSMAYSLFFRTESYDADFEQDRNGWSWWLKRISISNLNIIFKDEVLLFDYPLVLNKTWGGHTIALLNVGKMQIPMRFDYEGKITRYISEYEVPIELGLSADLEKAEAKFINASQLHTPDKNVYAPGILVTELELKPLGWMPIKAEFYKDVRGCVPFQKVYIFGTPVMESEVEKWTGNIP